MQSASVSLIFPVFELKDERFRNFEFNLKRAISANVKDIIIVEQVRSLDRTSSFSRYPRVRYIPVVSSCDVIEKSRLVNAGVLASDADYVWVNDADIYCPFQQVIDVIKPYHICIKPFKYFIKLNEMETQEFLTERKVATQSNYMDGLCAGSFIIRRNEYIKIRGMDERYQGWGYEDMEFANRVQAIYPVEMYTQFRGVHLYHPKDTSRIGTNFTARNLNLYTEAKKIVAEDVLDQVNKVASPFERNMVWLGKEGRIVHVVSPCFNSKNPQFLHRQLLALSSINKSDDRGVIKIAALTRDEFDAAKTNNILADWRKEMLIRDATSIGHNRRLPFLKEMLDHARKQASPEDFLVLSNADCGVTRQFYKSLLNTPEDFVEYFRVNIYNPNSVEDLYSNDPSKTREEMNGIDAFAIRARLYDEVRDKIPDLMLGEPYWDPVISGMMKAKTEIVQNCYDLRHPDHRQEWNLHKLTIGGEYNKLGWQRAFDDGLLDIRKCELIHDTVIIRFHEDGHTNYKQAGYAFRKLREQDCQVNHVLVDICKDKRQSKLRDDDLGTTGGKRLLLNESDVVGRLTINDLIKDVVDKCPKARFIICLEEHALTDDTGAIRKIVQKLREDPEVIIEDDDAFRSPNRRGEKPLLTAMTRTKFKSLREYRASSDSGEVDTAVIIATFGDDPLRSAANAAAFWQLQKQSLKVKYIWLELLAPGQLTTVSPAMRTQPNFEHVIIHARPQNERLFQKEALWNMAVAKLPPNIRFLFFLDSDIYCDKPNWFAKIREALDFDSNAIIQPGSEVVTLKLGGHPEITRCQMTFMGHEDIKPSKQPYNFNPGIAVCMTRKLFDTIGGFNPYGVMYGGDTIFLIETNKNSHQFYRHLMNQSSMRYIIRKDIINRKDLKVNWKGVDNYITHVWHGDDKNRTYWVWEHFLTTIDFNAMRWLYIDDQGLLAWREKYPLFDYIYDRKATLSDKFICKRLIREFYEEQEQASKLRTLFAPGNFAVELWTMNVAREANELPVVSDSTDTFLRLKGERINKASNGFVAVISFAPHFVTVDTTEMENPALVFDARALRVPSNEILIALQSKEDDTDKAAESPRLDLSKYANVTDQWTTVRIPLRDFDQVNKARLYAVMIKGVGEFTLDIRSMKVES